MKNGDDGKMQMAHETRGRIAIPEGAMAGEANRYRYSTNRLEK